jgi:hypothetical protein
VAAEDVQCTVRVHINVKQKRKKSPSVCIPSGLRKKDNQSKGKHTKGDFFLLRLTSIWTQTVHCTPTARKSFALPWRGLAEAAHQ